MTVDEDGVLIAYRDAGLPVMVPDNLVNDVMAHVHGTQLTRHYRHKHTIAQAKRRSSGQCGARG